jgi:hypothetical protein
VSSADRVVDGHEAAIAAAWGGRPTRSRSSRWPTPWPASAALRAGQRAGGPGCSSVRHGAARWSGSRRPRCPAGRPVGREMSSLPEPSAPAVHQLLDGRGPGRRCRSSPERSSTEGITAVTPDGDVSLPASSSVGERRSQPVGDGSRVGGGRAAAAAAGGLRRAGPVRAGRRRDEIADGRARSRPPGAAARLRRPDERRRRAVGSPRLASSAAPRARPSAPARHRAPRCRAPGRRPSRARRPGQRLAAASEEEPVDAEPDPSVRDELEARRQSRPAPRRPRCG